MAVKKWAWFAVFLCAAGCAPRIATAAQQALVVEEHLLSGEPDISTDQLVFHFAAGDQEQILAHTAPYRDPRVQITEYNNRVLAAFGYRFENYQQSVNGYPQWYSRIYHGEDEIGHGADWVKPASVNASGTDFIIEMEIMGGTYLLTRDHFEILPYPAGIEPEAYVGDRLLSVELASSGNDGGMVNIYLDKNLVYQGKTGYTIPFGPTDGPWSFNGHWAIVLLVAGPNVQGGQTVIDHVVQDGQDLNTKYGYDQSFQFALLDDRPLYFHQKDGKINLSFDGRDIPANYDEVPHYYCCSPALLNPRVSMNMIWFFARRGQDWYYIEAYVPAGNSQ